MSLSDPHGLLVLDKPVGPTSRDAVDRSLRWFPRKTRIGHTGTLDPLASGVLVLCIGQATRLTEYVQDMPKTYLADVVLGSRSATDDAEGPITNTSGHLAPGRGMVETTLAGFIGQIEQVPPAFSAAKVAGRRAYALARRGTTLELSSRIVRIDGINILDFDYPRLRIEVHCGKGAYIRSLARDLGERLGCGAYLGSLRRTRVGPFQPSNAPAWDADAATALAQLLPPAAAVADLPHVTVSSESAARLRHGQAISVNGPVLDKSQFAVFDADGSLVAIAESNEIGHGLRPAKVFPA